MRIKLGASSFLKLSHCLELGFFLLVTREGEGIREGLQIACNKCDQVNLAKAKGNNVLST